MKTDFARSAPDRTHFEKPAAPGRRFQQEKGGPRLEEYVRKTYAKQFDALALMSRAEGREVGRKEGADERARSAALNFPAMGLSPERVLQGIGLPLGEVRKLQRDARPTRCVPAMPVETV